MKTNRYLLGLALLVAGALPTFAQVSNDNEDGVNKVDEHAIRNDFVPGQVLVKFKDESSVNVNKARGAFRSVTNNAVNAVLKEFNVEKMDKLLPNAKSQEHSNKSRSANRDVVEEKDLSQLYLVETDEAHAPQTMQLVEKLSKLDEVEYAEPNYLVYITSDVPSGYGTMGATQQQNTSRASITSETTASVICSNPSSNPLYFRQYGITQQNIHKLWNKPIINKKRPVIAILDTGVDINHPDLAANIWTNKAEAEGESVYDDDGNGIVDDKYGWNFVDDYYDLTDYNGHGTHVAGIAAAADNSIGIVGANPLALIMPVKVMNDRGVGDIATINQGILYAVENGADIINMSFGMSTRNGKIPNALKDVLDKAYQTTILVSSAGNNGSSIYDYERGRVYPAAYHLVLGVEASGSNLQRASYSNYDPDGPIYSEDGIDRANYEIQVPGDKIYSTLPNGQYNQLSGTSMSAPLLAGAISALQMVKDYPSKDVLFGDLIHLKADFEKIYSNDTPRTPKIDLLAIEMDDNVNSNTNVDGRVDVGETVKFYPILRNTWADATNIKLKLSVDKAYQNFVDILNPQVDFGYSISAYGQQKAQTPIIVMFNNNIGNNTRIKFNLEVYYHESAEPIQQEIYVSVNNMAKIGGMITEDKTLTADHEWLVTSNLAIPEGVTLTIQPGTVIRFNNNAGISNVGTFIANGTPENPIIMTSNGTGSWKGIDGVSLKYCKLYNIEFSTNDMKRPNVIFDNCELNNYCSYYLGQYTLRQSNLINSFSKYGWSQGGKIENSNVVNCNSSDGGDALEHFPLSLKPSNNWINSYTEDKYLIGKSSATPVTIIMDEMPYFGTSSEEILRPYIYELGNDFGRHNTFAWYDLTNMKKEPVAEAHAIVWKVVVNGKDAQDEYEDLAPLGVGKHKFEVYFNRPMNKAVAPQISFGVREPYTQNAVSEDGSWNEEGTIYTAYKTIGGKTMSDGVNRIYVQGAEDNEYFECPYEKTRFNINVQAAGSMATGFAGEAQMGRVKLTWNNENNDFEDAMGFNIYRYQLDNEGKADTICINKDIVGIETTEYTDYDVTPGETYYYMYKVLSTDLKEYDVSNVVAVTPLTSTMGDANGSGDVDVADVITTVNYAAGMKPKPFIFEAADMNTDLQIDILDVVGIIQKILNPSAQSMSLMSEATATYTVEDGVLYVESPVALGGVQVQLNMNEKHNVTTTETLNDFEQVSAWLSDNDMLFLAYNINGKILSAGKHALLSIGDADISDIKLSNTIGHNVKIEKNGSLPTGVQAIGAKVFLQGGVFNMNGQKVTGNETDLKKLPNGVYIINGKKVVK